MATAPSNPPPAPRAPQAPRAWLAGGGTGGHVMPALAVGEELRARGWRVSFVGSGRELERRLAEARGFPYEALAARPVVGRRPRERAAAAWTLLRSALAARRLARRQSVDLVVGTGGYASAPAVLGARLAGSPALLVEPNARAGAANRFLSRLASGAALGYASARGDVRCPAWVTGVPVRPEFHVVPPGLPAPPPRLLVLGGSQGARQLNELLPAALALLGDPPRVMHQCGERHLETTRAAYAAAGLGGQRVELAPFLADVAGAMADAHLVVSRAGAMTLAELCAAGRPALLVPLRLAGGHQEENARLLERAGAARLLATATPEGLAAALADLLGDAGRLAGMAAAARSLARRDAATAIADRSAALVAARRSRGRGGHG
jgi:UDP-N-acetylglucosamine--N-acetylmuramyl-(pentapeptide) pyrophosphoryl-undecaprenol N-acetylglucosamine transferase